MNPRPALQTSNLPLALWGAYLFFVVYGSLVPLKYKARSFEDAWAAFQNIPFLQLGVGSRADWISNGVLYVPLGFLTAYLLAQSFQRAPRYFLWMVAGAFSFALAFGVEFIQLYFPQRTVSLNDILAECIGSVLGIFLAATKAPWFSALLDTFTKSTQRLGILALEGYAFAYVALSLFPFDFFVSGAELSQKIESGGWGWFIAGNTPRFTVASLQLLAEVVLTLPFGFWLGRLAKQRRVSLQSAAWAGLALGFALEVAQFFMASGISQGLSVVTRVAGVCGGFMLSRHVSLLAVPRARQLLRRFTLHLSAAYLLVMLEINGYFSLTWRSLADAAAQIAQTNFIPFYYHYYTSEANALFSLGVVALSYTPIAVLAWAHARSPRFAVGAALVVCSLIEAGKLFLVTAHPDPTNLLIACTASGLTVLLIQMLVTAQTAAVVQAPSPATVKPRAFPAWLGLVLAASGIWALAFPAFPALVGMVLAACAFVVWRQPIWAFTLVPAALPVFDLAPWSGRFFWDEFDTLLAVCLAVAFARIPAQPMRVKTRKTWILDQVRDDSHYKIPESSTPHLIRGRYDMLGRALMALLALSFLISTLRGFLPFQWPDANAFGSYYSPYNALRIVKGAVWAYLYFSLYHRLQRSGQQPYPKVALGMVLGLALTVAAIVWERAIFTGLFDFSNIYRVTGPFSAMHIGGAYIECYLSMAVPFLIILILQTKQIIAKASGIFLLLATTYALMVTFSRNGYAAFAVAIALTLIGYAWQSRQKLRTGALLATLVVAMLAIALPIYQGDFVQTRMRAVNADLGVRQSHWADAMGIRNNDSYTSLFGMGLGRFPDTSYWRSTLHPRPATHRIEADANNTFLRLGAGDPVYVEQLVNLEPNVQYQLTLDIRQKAGLVGAITVSVCEKWMLTSFHCVQVPLKVGAASGKWQATSAAFSTAALQPGLRPIKLSFMHTAQQSTLDIDNLKLIGQDGQQILRNGDFSAGLDRWFFASDGHLQWHTKSLLYGILFDQGWFGLLAMGLFFAYTLARAGAKTFTGSLSHAALLAAVCSFLVVGIFDTLIDSPRFLMLVLFIAAICTTPVGAKHDNTARMT